MKRLAFVLWAALAITSVTGPAVLAVGVGSAFTYQGQLRQNGLPAEAAGAAFTFRLWNAETGGTQVGSNVTVSGIPVSRGLFSVQIDFGSTAFNGDARWLEIGVDTAGGTAWTWLTPRQPVKAAPYALYALNGSQWLNGTDLIYYNAGDVGIGTSAPTASLEVLGSASKLGATAIHGRLTASSNTNYGIRGTIASLLGAGVQGEASNASGGVGVRGKSTAGSGVVGVADATSGTTYGVYGTAHSPDGQAVRGLNDATTGNAVGVYGETASADGYGGYFQGDGYFSGNVGIGVLNPQAPLTLAGGNWDVATGDGDVQIGNTNGRLKIGVATSGGGVGITRMNAQSATASPKLILGAGGADLLAIWSTSVGIGTGTSLPASGTKLDVVGKIKATGFQLGTSTTSGYILTADASGNASWQANAGGSFSLPYSGSVSSTSPVFSITNTGTGMSSSAIRAAVTNASINSDAQAGSFSAIGTDAYAIGAWADRTAIYASADTGNAIYGTSSGTGGGYFSTSLSGGYGVKGVASNASGTGSGGSFQSSAATGNGVYGYATGTDGKGVYGYATGSSGTGVYARASGVNANALLAEATNVTGVGLVAKGQLAGARIYGHLELYEYGTTNKVLEMGKGLDYAEGFDVAGDNKDVGPGTVLVIDPKNPGRLAMSRTAYDRKVAGIVAGANGLGSGVRLGAGQFDRDVALAGRVYCNVVAGPEGIEPGDLLTTSEVPGRAMKAGDHARSQGAILGKAMEPLAAGNRGQILVLVTLQ